LVLLLMMVLVLLLFVGGPLLTRVWWHRQILETKQGLGVIKSPSGGVLSPCVLLQHKNGDGA
jgi:hypothetical protein